MNNNKWAIIGCDELSKYFRTIGNIPWDGSHNNMYYFINNKGDWDYNFLRNKPADIELITVADYLFKLPEKWCVKLLDNYDTINNWGKEYFEDKGGWGDLNEDTYLLCDFENDYCTSENYKYGYEEITYDQFIKHVLNKYKMNTQTLTRAQLIEMHAKDSCIDWRKEIEYILLSAPLALDTTPITIPQKSIDLLIKMGSATQKSLVMSAGIKLEEDKSVELPPAAIQEQRLGVLLGTRNGGEYKNKSFYLNNSLYNWEIKTDSMGTLCLIPTKK